MGGFGLAVAACLVLLWVPGLAAAMWLLPGSGRLVRLVAAPAFSCALLFGLASYLELIHVRVEWQTVALPLVLIGVGLLGLASRRRPWPSVHFRAGHLVLVIAVVAAAALWIAAIGSLDQVPTNDDGAQHGILTDRIGQLGSVHTDQIVATDLSSGYSGISYYPLGLHLIASFVIKLTGVSTGLGLHVVLVVCAALVMPLGTYVLTRRIAASYAPRPDVIAGVAAVVVAVLPTFPWGQLTWGPLPLVTAASMVPAVVMVALGLGDGRRLAGPATGLALAGVFVVHNSQAAAAVILAASMLIAMLGRNARRWTVALRRLVPVLAVALVVLLPVLGSLAGGAGERGIGVQGTVAGPLDAVRLTWLNLTIGPPSVDSVNPWQYAAALVLTALVAVGIWAGRGSRLVIGLASGSAVIVFVIWGSVAGLGWARVLSFPWYSSGYRLGATLCIPVAVFVAAGAGLLWQRRSTRLILVPVGAVALSACVATSLHVGTGTYERYSVVTTADRAAFAWLGEHDAAGSRVLNDYGDGSMWMYDLAGVDPVFGPKTDLWTTPAWADRLYLLSHAADMDDRARAIAEAYGVRYVVVGERIAADHTRLLDADALAASPDWREVFRSGDALVFERTS